MYIFFCAKNVFFIVVDEVGEKLDIGDTPLEISTEVMEDKDSKEVDGSEVIKVYIFKAEADDDLGKCLTMSIPKTLYFQKITIKVMVITS